MQVAQAYQIFYHGMFSGLLRIHLIFCKTKKKKIFPVTHSLTIFQNQTSGVLKHDQGKIMLLETYSHAMVF